REESEGEALLARRPLLPRRDQVLHRRRVLRQARYRIREAQLRLRPLLLPPPLPARRRHPPHPGGRERPRLVARVPPQVVRPGPAHKDRGHRVVVSHEKPVERWPLRPPTGCMVGSAHASPHVPAPPRMTLGTAHAKGRWPK